MLNTLSLKIFWTTKNRKWKFEKSSRPRSLWFSPQLVEWWTVCWRRYTRMKSLTLLEVLLMMAWEVHTIQSMFDHSHHQVFLWVYIISHNTRSSVILLISSIAASHFKITQKYLTNQFRGSLIHLSFRTWKII